MGDRIGQIVPVAKPHKKGIEALNQKAQRTKRFHNNFEEPPDLLRIIRS